MTEFCSLLLHPIIQDHSLLASCRKMILALKTNVLAHHFYPCFMKPSLLQVIENVLVIKLLKRVMGMRLHRNQNNAMQEWSKHCLLDRIVFWTMRDNLIIAIFVVFRSSCKETFILIWLLQTLVDKMQASFQNWEQFRQMKTYSTMN